jgi:hypothetical protein
MAEQCYETWSLYEQSRTLSFVSTDDDFEILGTRPSRRPQNPIGLGTGNQPLPASTLKKKDTSGLSSNQWQGNRPEIEQERRSYGRIEAERKKKTELGGKYELGNRSPSPTKKQFPTVSKTMKFYIWVCFKNSRFWTGHGNCPLRKRIQSG